MIETARNSVNRQGARSSLHTETHAANNRETHLTIMSVDYPRLW